MEDNKFKKKSVETYAEDMARAIESNEAGMIKKIIHEQEAHERDKKLFPDSRENKLFALGGSALIVVALLVVGFFYLRPEIYSVEVAEQAKPLIFTDASKTLEVDGLTKNKIISNIWVEVLASRVKEGGIEDINLSEGKIIIGLRKFLQMTSMNFIPGKVVDNNFLIGVYKHSPFILFKVLSFTDAYPHFKAWEEHMFSDLHNMFGEDYSALDWQDGIIQNKNARILWGNDGKMVLFYTFANDTSVVVANSEDPVREVIRRLSSSTIQK